MSRREVLSKYSNVKKWDLQSINNFASDLGLQKGVYDMLVDREVFYNYGLGTAIPTGQYVLNYLVKKNTGDLGYIQVKRDSLREIASFLFKAYNR